MGWSQEANSEIHACEMEENDPPTMAEKYSGQNLDDHDMGYL